MLSILQASLHNVRSQHHGLAVMHSLLATYCFQWPLHASPQMHLRQILRAADKNVLCESIACVVHYNHETRSECAYRHSAPLLCTCNSQE